MSIKLNTKEAFHCKSEMQNMICTERGKKKNSLHSKKKGGERQDGMTVLSDSQKMTDTTNSQLPKRRVWHKVSLNDRLKLESAVNFGLPVHFAGKVVGIESSNPDRIIKDFKVRREMEIASLEQQTPEQRDIYMDSMQESMNEAELQALMAVVKAKDAGVIKTRNILKMDRKVNESLR